MAEDSQADVTVVDQQQQPSETGDTQVATPTTNDDDLGEVSERTRERFDTLTKSNQELKRQYEEVATRAKSYEAALLDYQKSQQKPESQPDQVTPESFIDPNTGLLNEQAFNNYQKRAIEAEKNAQEAKALVEKLAADQKQRETELQNEIQAKEAYQAHPDLNPEDKTFNKDLSDLTSAIMLRSMLHPEEFNGKELSFKQAGDRAKSAIEKIVSGAREEGAQEALDQLDQKEQAAFSTTGSPNRRQTAQQNLDTLRQKSRHGDLDAMIARMQAMKAGGSDKTS